MAKVECNSKKLHEIIKQCKNLGWNPEDVKIECEIWEDITEPDEPIIKFYLKNSKK